MSRAENFKAFVAERELDDKVAFANEILRVNSGSEVLGTSVGGGDYDFIGVFIEPPEYVVGFKQADHFTARSQPEGERSQPGDIDYTAYSLRKFMSLAIQGNPSILNVLYTPDEHICSQNKFGMALIDFADAIVSKRAVPRFLGYLNSQKKRLQDELKGHMPKRPELIEEFGYDTKYAMHAVRLGHQCVELLQDEGLTLPLKDADWFLQVRNGRYTLQEIINIIEFYEKTISSFEAQSNLRDEPDMFEMNAWMVKMHMKYWKWDHPVEVMEEAKWILRNTQK